MIKEWFKKDFKCDRCGVVFPKSSRCEFDTTEQAGNKDGYIIHVCEPCLMALFDEAIQNFQYKAIWLEPVPGMNAFTTFNFEFLVLPKEKNEDKVERFKSILPSDDSKCETCGQKAVYTWVKMDCPLMNPFLWTETLELMSKPIHLCKCCLSERLKKDLDEKGIRLKTIWPQVTEDGFYLPREL
jgi:hypothetical protein